jgi:hypothetical protein
LLWRVYLAFEDLSERDFVVVFVCCALQSVKNYLEVVIDVATVGGLGVRFDFDSDVIVFNEVESVLVCPCHFDSLLVIVCGFGC